MSADPKEIDVLEFAKRCIVLLSQLPPEGLVVTRDGRPIARVLPTASTRDLIGVLRGGVEVHGDLINTSELLEDPWPDDDPNLARKR